MTDRGSVYEHGTSHFVAKYPECPCEPCEDQRERSAMRRLRLSPDPIIEIAEKLFPPPDPTGYGDGYAQMGGWAGNLSRTRARELHRARQHGYLGAWLADELATSMGLHPSQIWGDEWLGL